MTYLMQCNKYFSPLDEIYEALVNNEGVSGISNEELVGLVKANAELSGDLYRHFGWKI